MRRQNISEGFMDSSGVFHPIRHAEDYSATRAGELKLRGGGSVRSALSKRKNPSVPSGWIPASAVKIEKLKGGGVKVHVRRVANR